MGDFFQIYKSSSLNYKIVYSSRIILVRVNMKSCKVIDKFSSMHWIKASLASTKKFLR